MQALSSLPDAGESYLLAGYTTTISFCCVTHFIFMLAIVQQVAQCCIASKAYKSATQESLIAALQPAQKNLLLNYFFIKV